MKKLDVKHIAYHVLIGLYFVWLVVFGALIAMALINFFTSNNNELGQMFMVWILFNLIMGTALYLVIRLFRKKNALYKVVFYIYFFMVAATVATLLIIIGT